MALFGLQALTRRLGGQRDPRGAVGIMSRGKNVYNGGTNSAQAGSQLKADPRVKTVLGSSFQRNMPRFGGIQHPGGAFRNVANQLMGQAPGGAVAGQNPQIGQQEGLFRYNPQYEAAMRKIMEQQASLRSQEERAKRMLEDEYQTSLRGLGTQREDALEALKNRMADQGILRSGINVGEQGEIGEAYQGAVNELSGGRARALEQLQAQIAAQEQALQSQGMEAEFARAREEQIAALEEALAEAEARSAEEAARIREELMQQEQQRWTQQPYTEPGKTWYPTQPGGVKTNLPSALFGYPSGQLANAVRGTGHNYGGRVDLADIERALRNIGHDFGGRVDPADVDVLLRGRSGGGSSGGSSSKGKPTPRNTRNTSQNKSRVSGKSSSKTSSAAAKRALARRKASSNKGSNFRKYSRRR